MITRTPSDPEVTLADDTPVDDQPRRPARGGSRRRWWILPLLAIILIVAIWLIVRLVNGGTKAPRYVTAPVGYQNISATVEETGTVNPVNEVDVGTQVSGTIATLGVDFNSIVHKGQVLATLDPTPLEAASLQAHENSAASQSSAAAAQSTAAQAAAAIQSAQANVAKAAAALKLAQATLARDRQLLARGYISQSQMDTDTATESADEADLNAAQASIATASYQHNANLAQAQAAQAQSDASQGQVQQADYNLARAVITSPIDGIVVARDVSVGQTVAASFQTPTLFVIASSLRDMQIDTSVSEADVGQLRTGATARITVPAYPNTAFNGTVTQVRVNPTTVQNVVTYDAIVAVHDDSARLKPGMTADVIIAVQTKNHVLAIPAAALLFRPPSQSGRGGAGGQSGGGAQGGSQTQGGQSGGQSGQGQAGGGQSGGGAGAGGGAQGQGQNGGGSGGGGAVAGAPGSHASIFVLRGGQPVRVRVTLGVNDGRFYEIRSGELQAGDRVIVGLLQTDQYTNSNPMAGGVGFGR
ncbi:MAG TPA: efflux RND transporter periplasmic adaptor subunit [Candidatus Eremiobacteraceae bacterium]|nr:efflux RND transporter periplasmic adaptor subunit [Candidatus Eremiobacteraceae bacterium]